MPATAFRAKTVTVKDMHETMTYILYFLFIRFYELSFSRVLGQNVIKVTPVTE